MQCFLLTVMVQRLLCTERSQLSGLGNTNKSKPCIGGQPNTIHLAAHPTLRDICSLGIDFAVALKAFPFPLWGVSSATQ